MVDSVQRAKVVIENCAHPIYRPLLREYLAMGKSGQTNITVQAALAFHAAFKATGDMRTVDWAKYGF